jgi:DnaJ-class molecular chaperone
MQLTECFRILQVEPGAPWQVIKKSYYSLAKSLHPDINPQSPNAESEFKEINQAFQVLRSHFSRPDEKSVVKVRAKTWTFLLQRIICNHKLQKWKSDCAIYLGHLETYIFQLNVHKKIHVSNLTAQSGANIYLKSGREKLKIKVPSGNWNQMSLSVPGKGESSLFTNRRGDLILNLQTPQMETINGVGSCFSYEMAIDKGRVGRIMTLNSSEGPIKFALPRNTVNGQTFCLKSRADSDSKHVLTVLLV